MNPYVFTGKYRDAPKAQGMTNALVELTPENKKRLLDADLPRQVFLGESEETLQYETAWRESSDTTYSQGDMDARTFLGGSSFVGHCLNVSWLDAFNDPELYRATKDNEKEFSVGYFDDEGNVCGFCVYYNDQNPSQWDIGIIRNANQSPEEREIFLMSSFKLGEPYAAFAENPNRRIAKEFHSKKMSEFFSDLIGPDGHLRAGLLPLDELAKRVHGNEKPRTLDPSNWFHARKAALGTMKAKLPSQIETPKNFEELTPEVHAYLVQKTEKLRAKATQLETDGYPTAAQELRSTASKIEGQLEIVFTLERMPDMKNSKSQKNALLEIHSTIKNVSQSVTQLPGVLGILKKLADFVYEKTGKGERMVRFFKDMREKEIDDVASSISQVIPPPKS